MSGHDLVTELREGGRMPAPPRARGSIIDILLAVAVVVAVASVGYFGVSRWLLSSPPPAASPPVASAGAADAAAWTEADAAGCKVKAQAAANAPLPDETGLANRAVTEGFAGLATGLDCFLTTRIARFCVPSAKAEMVAAVNDYLSRVDFVELGLGVQGAPMALMGGLFGGEMAGGSAVYDEQRKETLQFMASFHKRIAADLRTLAEGGIATPADFAGALGGVPQSISAMFGETTAQRNLCA